MSDEIPYGYCQCGCGQKTRVAVETCRNKGQIKDQPLKYINGHNSTMDYRKRFWKYVDKKGDDQCWNWIGSKDKSGYGKLSINNRPVTATRISYEMAYGEFDQSLFVCHRCDNPTCVNPRHLFLGTAMDNTQDMLKKGRAKHNAIQGERNTKAKLTDEKVRDIRKLSSEGVSQYELARRFNVHQATIWFIVHRFHWRHVE